MGQGCGISLLHWSCPILNLILPHSALPCPETHPPCPFHPPAPALHRAALTCASGYSFGFSTSGTAQVFMPEQLAQKYSHTCLMVHLLHSRLVQPLLHMCKVRLGLLCESTEISTYTASSIFTPHPRDLPLLIIYHLPPSLVGVGGQGDMGSRAGLCLRASSKLSMAL